MNIILTLILAVNAVLLVFFLLFLRKVKALYEEFQGFVTAPDEKSPSQLANVVALGGDLVASSFANKIKASFMGGESGAIRAEKGIDGDIALDIAQQNPLVGAALSQFPNLRRTLRRNPAMVDYALQKLAPVITRGFGPASPPSGNNGNSSYQSSLGI